MATIAGADQLAGERSRPVYTRVQVLGLLLVAATLLVVAAIAIATEPAAAGEVVGFIGPIAAAALLAAWMAWRFGTWARIIGIVVSLGVAFMMFWTVFGLAAPDSFADFVLGVGVPTGILLGVGGGIAALVAGRRGRIQAGPARGEQRLVRGVLVVVAVALAVSAVLTIFGRTSVDPALAAGATTVDMSDFEFVPAVIEVDASDPRLVVTNSDAFLHDLAVPALDAIVRVTPGSSDLLDLSGAAPGTYTAYCTLHSDTRVADPTEAGMAATLVIR